MIILVGCSFGIELSQSQL